MNFIARIENWKDINTTYKYKRTMKIVHILLIIIYLQNLDIY